MLRKFGKQSNVVELFFLVLKSKTAPCSIVLNKNNSATSQLYNSTGWVAFMRLPYIISPF